MPTPTGDTVSPWTPMTNVIDKKVLGKLIEELGECTSAAARCFIQGLYDSEPLSGKVNKVWLEEEIADVLANITLTVIRFDLDEQKIHERAAVKRTKLKQWHQM